MQENKERVAQTVVTSENLAEFTAKKLGLADETPDASLAVNTESVNTELEGSDGQSEHEGDASDAPTTDEPEKERKSNSRLERQFSKITKQREEAREEARREREARESLEIRIRDLEARTTNESDDDSISSDLKEKLKKEIKEELRIAAEKEKIEKDWATRVNKTAEEIPDFYDTCGSADVYIPAHIQETIMESEVGPRILYHLAENPEYAEDLVNMKPSAAIRELVKLEQKFNKSISKDTEIKSSPVVGKSKAPAPISPIRGAVSVPDTGLDSNGNFTGTYQDYKAARLAGRIR